MRGEGGAVRRSVIRSGMKERKHHERLFQRQRGRGRLSYLWRALNALFDEAARCLCQRCVPHMRAQLNDRNAYEIANVHPLVIPVLGFADRKMQKDSPPLVFELEMRFARRHS